MKKTSIEYFSLMIEQVLESVPTLKNLSLDWGLECNQETTATSEYFNINMKTGNEEIKELLCNVIESAAIESGLIKIEEDFPGGSRCYKSSEMIFDKIKGVILNKGEVVKTIRSELKECEFEKPVFSSFEYKLDKLKMYRP